MKVETKTEAVAPNQHVPLDHIVNHKELTYRALDSAHVEALVADIGANGLDQPLLTFTPSANQQVRLKGSQDAIPATYLVAGLHRRAALLQLRRAKPTVFAQRFPKGVPILHRVTPISEALLLQIRENVQRREMSAEEIFPILEKLASAPYNMKGKDIATKVGKSTSWVSQMMAVNEELDPETKEDVKAGKIAVGDARKLAGEVRSDRKAGKTVTKEEIKARATTLKQKQAVKASTGAQRATGDDRKVSLKRLWSRYRALPTGITSGRCVKILEQVVRYLLGEVRELPPELRQDAKPSKVVAAKK